MANSPEYSTIQAHIADINQRIAAADLSTYADELLQAGLITLPSHASAIVVGRAPFQAISALTAEAMTKIKTSPHLFDALVDILEKRDQELASILRRECSHANDQGPSSTDDSSQLKSQGVGRIPSASTRTVKLRSRAKPNHSLTVRVYRAPPTAWLSLNAPKFKHIKLAMTNKKRTRHTREPNKLIKHRIRGHQPRRPDSISTPSGFNSSSYSILKIPGLDGQQQHSLTDNLANKYLSAEHLNTSAFQTFQPNADVAPPNEGLPYTKLVAQKEKEIQQLTDQLDHAMATKEQEKEENTEMIRMHKLAIVQLQDDLKLKYSELNKLRQEMKDLYMAITSREKEVVYYAMPNTPHGICLIINNHVFHLVDPRYEALSDRGGAPVDQRNLVLTFEFLQYKVEVHENCTSIEMIDLMKEMSSRDHSQYDSFVCCILSHGEEGIVYGADSLPVDLRDMTALMKGTFCRTLLDKPKLFFVQADRGEVEDPGIEVLSDGKYSLPVEADFFFGYATPLRYTAYRSRRHGSWYISELCHVFSQDSQVLGLSSMMKKVNRKVSEAFTKEGYKQCTEVVDRLRKEVHFFRDFTPKK